MSQEFEELKRLITEVRDEAREDMRKDFDEENKLLYSGQVQAYNYCLQMIKIVANPQPI